MENETMGKKQERKRERERETDGETRSHARPENSTLESYGQIKSGINAVTCLAGAHTRAYGAPSADVRVHVYIQTHIRGVAFT